MKLVHCTHAGHGEAVRAIFNHAILHSTALYEYQERTPQQIQEWFRLKQDKGFPVLGVENAGGELLGFASYGGFRQFPAYKYSVEHSLYVREDQRGQGIGERLLRELITVAEQQSYHCLIGAIDADNAASVALHRKLGFDHCGTIRQAGFKFGRWLDLVFYQYLLRTPAEPVDG